MSGTRLSWQTSIVGGIALEQAYKKIINIKDNDAVCSGADPDGNWLLHSGPPPLLFEETGCVVVLLSSFWFGRGCIYGGTEALVCVL